MKRILVLGLLVTFVGLAGMVGAQTLTGTITGRVTDEQGGVLPGVTVTLTGSTGSQTQVTDAQGAFRFMGLPPGSYSVKSELSGFRPKQQQNIDVTIGKTIDVPLALAVGGLTETVDVIANAITVDTTTTKTDTNMSQEVLFSMPLSHNNPAVNILQYSPGVNSGSAFGGAADGANSLMLDGVDTRDPEGGTAWAFYNFNIIDEVQVGSLGQPAEYGGFTGAIINTITKSGGNRFSFLSEYRYSSDGLGGDNLTGTSVIGQNPAIFPTQVMKYKDYTVQLGGPLKKDKVFFFGSIQRYNIEQHVSRPLRTEVSPRFNIKFTFQPSPSDNIVASLQYDQYNQKGRTAWIPGYAVVNDDQTVNQDSPEYIYNAQYRKVFNSSTFLEAKFTGWWGYYYLNPRDHVSSQFSPAGANQSAHYDGDLNQYFGGAGYTYLADRTRNQVNASLSKYAQMAGAHNFKFGVEIERSTIRDRFAYTNGVAFYDYGGFPYYAYGYSYDLQGKNQRESFYAQDQWKMGRFTLNLGLRADNIRGSDAATGKQIYSSFSLGPRVGFALDVSGKGTSVVRGYYGQMYESAVFSSWSRATSGLTPTNYYWVGNADGEPSTIQNWTVASGPYDTIQRTYTTGSDLNHPRVDEINFGFEQEFARTYKFTATAIFRDWKNFLNSTLDNGQWTPFPYTPADWTFADPSPISGQPLTLYKWANKTTIPDFTIGNTDSVNYTLTTGTPLNVTGYRKYRGLMLIFERAYKNRWQARVSYVLSKTTGTINNSTYAGISSGQFETPNAISVNADGPTAYDRRHEVKVFAGYQIPKAEISINGYWRFLSGTPYTPYARVSGSTVGWPNSVNVNLVAPGAFRYDNETNLDVRFEKVLTFGANRFGIYGDVQNLFNQMNVLSVQTRYPSATLSYHNPADADPAALTDVKVPFGFPLAVSASRQVTFGFRWSF
jgi:hypothetical protein